MSSLDARSNSAVMKRAEQLKRWEESDTNRAAPTPRHEHGRRIKFSSGCVFLAACLSGDKDEVIQLLDQGADINTANVDGLTALHQACIDDNLDMVEFLVERGADINRQDNEGWTPLHATASCGFVSIARYLVENGADVAAVNSDGDLALDLAIDVQHMGMIDYMEKMVQELNINVEEARKAEEQAMLNDAKKWLRSDAAEVDRPHPKTGATALHVAAAKGYTKVLSLLLAGRGNVDRQDNDGWTPLHAASHWGQRETAEMLVESLADMDIRNYAGQSCIDVADRKIVKFLEELRANKRNKRRPSSQISRISDAIENHVDKTPTKLVRVEVRTDATKDAENVKPNQQIHAADHHPVEEEAPWRRKLPRTPNDSPTNNQVPDRELSSNSSETANDVILRRTQSFENDQKKSTVTIATPTSTAATANTTALSSPSTTVQNPPIRRSFVPPVRDEESETQRKAHAKRVRETRRSTQGVTLDEIKSAEELVKKKNLGMANNNNNNNINTTTTNTISNSSFKLEDITSGGTYPPNNSTIIPSAPAVMAAANLSTTTGVQRRISSGPNALNASNQSLNSVGRPVSAPSESSTNNSSAYVTPSARKYETNATSTASAAATNTNTTSNSVSATSANHATTAASNATSNHDDKDNDKENDNRTQTVIQRRRKPKRRSTGVVHIDMDELDPERQTESNNDNEDKEKESGSERTSRSRLGSTASTATTSESKSDKAENGDGIDYKALWEAAKLENDKLKQMLKQKDDEVVQTRATLERFANAQLDAYKSDNHRLKEENAALIRVISKLSK
ncbi:protein phosphatase 1 regulatory subunit 12B isoform X19 [Drosophila kikkawai]|uniref:Protein phosphatase 1 regulatory subunit 12B isoform X19 n=1 Tax=Drosophila kikkawai TaxID=30033 RepID=A0ABM4GHH5_DROKI|nr:protein phosphatase 1 regulatory subunit 12A isoform X14 [Drosophila kikkawai]